MLQECLLSVFSSIEEKKIEVIVVDNSSSDGSADMVQTQFPQVRLFINQENRGFAAANNQAIREASGRYVLLLNPDTLVIDDCLDKVIAFADEHPHAGIVGCKVLNTDGTLQRSCREFPTLLNQFIAATYLYKLFPKNSFFGQEHLTYWSYGEARKVGFVSGCFFLIRQEVISEIGVLDEDYFMYAEEQDYAYRARSAGWEVFFTPEGTIIHHGGGSARQLPVKNFLFLHQSELRYFCKHHGFVTAWWANLIKLNYMILRFGAWEIACLLKPTERKKLKKECTKSAIKVHFKYLMPHILKQEFRAEAEKMYSSEDIQG
jgi:hypothetical protein